MAKSRKVKVELIESTDVRTVEEVKLRRRSTDKVDETKEEVKSDTAQPIKDKKKKKKKVDFLAEGKMPPTNRILPAMIFLVLLAAVYTGFNIYFTPENTDFMDDKTSTTGWQYHVKELKLENEKQQAQLNQLKGQIKIHDGIIAEQGKKINEQAGKIKQNKDELDKVTKDLEDFENKTGDELKELLKKKNELSERQRKLEEDMDKMKEADKLLRDDVEQLKNQTKQFEELFEKLSGDMRRGEKERKEMKENLDGLKFEFDKLKEYLKKQGIEVPESELPQENNQP